ncbi:hypothetical protein CHGG_03018 [Chaetomium globosum CBS 148.51]|uniref:Cation/H+ exchanger transmembrane domain-containing protein n=1 Tax=Chaetomium globosum (strain ATCC 6205 / CBS 148.51 / DSM 1962 / NBRC 6347 / NRRL 1970) TaxID=306901 RepID=Q2H9T6_CHAGB|nr:uncharacterized protein CHGG_03018 [Chaetomium globosum CBS 148.51]EAQ91083.1 hypothetical protein CHGG_03018 [Chaetomium globosum CBS 148.51]
MPNLDVSELNIVLSVLVPAVVIGVVLGPIAAKFLDSSRWASAADGQTSAITLGMARVVIGVQLVIAGFQLPAKYQQLRWKEMALCLLPIMTVMWLCTTLCLLATVPRITLLAALVIGSCVTCTDPILSQAIAKGPFAGQVRRPPPARDHLVRGRRQTTAFGFPIPSMLAVYLIRHADIPGAGAAHGEEAGLVARAGDVGRLGGGVGVAMQNWFVETWLYIVLMSVAIGALVGGVSMFALRFALRKKWVDSESYLLYPTAIGVSIPISYMDSTEDRHDEVNSCMDVLLNFGGFMYIGTIIPWSEFNQPDTTGLTYGRLIGLGVLVLLFRRIPAILMSYKFMPAVCKNYKEALFMGYFGPIGIGAVFYVEHARHLFPELGEGDAEETDLVRAMVPVVYWLVLFSIVVHGLSIPALNLIYRLCGVKPIQEDAVELRRMSTRVVTPVNATVGDSDTFIAYNRFSRPVFNKADLPPVNGVGAGDDDSIAEEKTRVQRRYSRRVQVV